MADPQLPPGMTLADPSQQGSAALPPGMTLDQPPAEASTTIYQRPAGTADAKVSAQPSTFTNWLQNAEADVRQGGARTAIGKVMTALGAQGTDVGAQGGRGGMLTSPVLGPIHYLQGLAEIPSHPLQGIWNADKAMLETATIPLMFAGGPGEAQAAKPNVQGAVDNFVASVKPTPLQAEKFTEAAQTAAPEMQKVAVNAAPQTRSQALEALAAHSKSLQPQYDAALNPVKDQPVPQPVLDSIAEKIEAHITPGLQRRFPDLAKKVQQTADLYRSGRSAASSAVGPSSRITYGELENMRYDLGSDLESQLEASGLKESMVRRDPNYAYRLTERDTVKNALYDKLGPEARRVKEMQSALQTIQRVMSASAGRDVVSEAAANTRTIPQKVWPVAKELMNIHAGNALQATGDAFINPTTAPNVQLQRAMDLFAGRPQSAANPNIVGNLAGLISASQKRP